MSMKTIYLDCSSGVCADMLTAALYGLVPDDRGLLEELQSVVPGCSYAVTTAERNAIRANLFTVNVPEQHHDGAHGTHYPDIVRRIQGSALPAPAKEMALRVYGILADAECVIHGKAKEDIHFHEVGSDRTVLTVCATASLLSRLTYDRILCSPLTDGTGTVKTAHGILPVPAPAVSKICETYTIPMTLTDVEGEMITPSGAALIAAVADGFARPQNAVLQKTGIGTGTRIYPSSNLLRACLLEEGADCPVEHKEQYHDQIIVLTTNIDDCTAEEMSFCMEQLFKAGVRDAFFTPIFMKKSRPAYSLTVLCKPEQEETAVHTIFLHTSSVGMRRTVEDRIIMEREPAELETPYGTVKAKKCTYEDISKVYIEYESAKELAEENGVSITNIYRNLK